MSQTRPRRAQEPEDHVTDVDLPPEESLVGGTLVVVMVVVPAFAERDQRQNKIVTAVVRGGVAAVPIRWLSELIANVA